jgi:hypothetical protein
MTFRDTETMIDTVFFLQSPPDWHNKFHDVDPKTTSY